MRLQTLSVEGFRGASNVELLDLQGLNILVGRNNSGKSTLLGAISGFFEHFRNGGVVTLGLEYEERPPGFRGQQRAFMRDVDYFRKDISRPIRIVAVLDLDTSETSSLVADIVHEAPQVENAARALGETAQLRVTLASSPPPTAFTYVERVVAIAQDRRETPLLQIQPEDAKEIAKALTRATDLRADATAIQRARDLDEDDWRRMNQGAYGFYYSRMDRPRVRRLVTGAANETDTYESFIEEVGRLSIVAEQEARDAEQQPLPVPISTFSGSQLGLPRYVTNLAQRIGETKVLHLAERRIPIGSDEAERILSLKVERGGQEQLRPIQETVAALLGVSIDAYRSQRAGQRGRDPAAELDVDDFLVELNGAGIREALRLILDVEFTKPDILLIEEPEVHLHPALEYRMREYLLSLGKHIQIFATTHSTNFLDQAAGLSAFLVTKVNDTTHAKKVSIEDDAAVVLSDLGVRPSALFLFDTLVFVEGPTDEAVMRRWFKSLNIDVATENVGFIHTVGTRNFRYFAAQGSLQFLIDRGLRVAFVRDRDELTDGEIQAIRARLPLECEFIVLGAREIENYLLHASAIAAALKDVRGQEFDTESIEQALDRAIDGVKESTAMRRVRNRILAPAFAEEIPPSRLSPETIAEGLQRLEDELATRRADLDALVQEARDELEERWQADKLLLAPGADVLDLVYKDLGVKFAKPRDAELIAAHLPADRIPLEVKTWMERLGR